MLPRYEIGDIIAKLAKIQPYRDIVVYHYLIIDKKFKATQDNMADLYLTICLDSGEVCDRAFLDTVYHIYKKVA